MATNRPVFPDRIGEYVFRRLLDPIQSYHRFAIAEYEGPRGTFAIAKKWTGSNFHFNYFRFQNEVRFYQAHSTLSDYQAQDLAKKFPRIRIPRFLGVHGSGRSQVLLIEKVDGNSIDSIPASKRLSIYEDSLAYIRELGLCISDKLQLRPYTALHQTLKFPIVALRALLRTPRAWRSIASMAYLFICSIPRLMKDRRMQFVHRDLWPGNIIVSSNNSVVLIDFDVSAYTHPFVDPVKLSLGLWDDVAMREIWKKSDFVRTIFSKQDDKSIFQAHGYFAVLFELGMPRSNREAALSFADFLREGAIPANFVQKSIVSKNLPTVTIGIPAFNEARTIVSLIKSLLTQRHENYVLEKIIVLSDASTDATVNEVRSLVDPRIHIHEGKVRRGKSIRMNQLFAQATSDIVVVLDADISVAADSCLDALIEPFLLDTSVSLVSGSADPVFPESTVQKIAAAGIAIWDRARSSARPNDFYYCEGTIRAFRRDLYTTMRFPAKSADDVYPFLYGQRNGFVFARAVDAKVYFTLPKRIREYIWQQQRFACSYDVHSGNFDPQFVQRYYTVTTLIKMKAALFEFIMHPLRTTAYLAVWCYVQVLLIFNSSAVAPIWQIAESTKDFRKKIIFSSYDDLHNPFYAGGGAVAVHQVAKRLALENDVTVLTGTYPGAEDVMLDGVRYHRVGISFFGPKIGQLLFALLLPWYVMRLHYDIWIESFTPPFSTSCLQLFTRKQVIGLVHMLAGDDMWRKYHIPFHLIERLGLKTYNRFIVLTDAVAKTIRRVNANATIDIINNGVDFPNENGTALEKEYISFIGRIEINQKGLDLLLKAYAHVQDRLPYKLAIAGTGSEDELAKLHALIGDLGLQSKVRLFGRVSGAEKNAVFSKSIFTVLPSRHETFSLVALETLSYSLPLLAFDIEGLQWLPDYCCMKIKPFDFEALGEKMLALALRADLRTKLALQGRAYINNFSWDEVSYKYRESISAALHTI